MTYRESNQSYGNSTNFMHSYGIKPTDPGAAQDALDISRAFKHADRTGSGYYDAGQHSGKK